VGGLKEIQIKQKLTTNEEKKPNFQSIYRFEATLLLLPFGMVVKPLPH